MGQTQSNELENNEQGAKPYASLLDWVKKPEKLPAAPEAVRCEASVRDGTRCRKSAMHGTKFCAFHKTYGPDAQPRIATPSAPLVDITKAVLFEEKTVDEVKKDIELFASEAKEFDMSEELKCLGALLYDAKCFPSSPNRRKLLQDIISLSSQVKERYHRIKVGQRYSIDIRGVNVIVDNLSRTLLNVLDTLQKEYSAVPGFTQRVDELRNQMAQEVRNGTPIPNSEIIEAKFERKES